MDKGKPPKKPNEKLTTSFTASKKKLDAQKSDRSKDSSSNHFASTMLKKRKDEETPDSISKLNAKKIKKDKEFSVIASTSNMKKIKKENNDSYSDDVYDGFGDEDDDDDDGDDAHELLNDDDDDDIDRLFGGPISEDEDDEEDEAEAIQLDPEIGKKLWLMEAKQTEHDTMQTLLKSKNSQHSHRPKSLIDLCVETIGNNLDMLDMLGSAPLHLLKPALSHANAEQLRRLESTSPAFKAISNKYWLELCLKDFPEQRESYIYKKGNHDKEYMRLEREKVRKQKAIEAKTKLLGQHSRERYRKLQEEKERKKTKFLDISSLPQKRNSRASRSLVQKIWEKTPKMSFTAPLRPIGGPKTTQSSTLGGSGSGPIRSTFRSASDRHLPYQRTTGSSTLPPSSRGAQATTRPIASQNRSSLVNGTLQKPNSQLGQSRPKISSIPSRNDASKATSSIRQTMRAAQEKPRKHPINNSSRSLDDTKAKIDRNFFNRISGGK